MANLLFNTTENETKQTHRSMTLRRPLIAHFQSGILGLKEVKNVSI